MPLQQHFTLHAFHPKALNDSICTWQVFWLAPVNHLPIPVKPEQWFEDLTGMWANTAVENIVFTYHVKAYSYGDSAGITPDFPFNPVIKREPNTGQM